MCKNWYKYKYYAHHLISKLSVKCSNKKCSKEYLKYKYGKQYKLKQIIFNKKKFNKKNKWYKCKGCKINYYCSGKCQKIDWSRGKHREICNKLGLNLTLKMMNINDTFPSNTEKL